METTLIEQGTNNGAYDMLCTEIIIDHPKHGRLLLVEGFGGVDSLAGGAYRWQHGIVAQLQPGDTLASLHGDGWNDYCNLYQAVVQGYDDSRPILDWTGAMIKSCAEKALR